VGQPADDAVVGELMAAWNETAFALERLAVALVEAHSPHLLALFGDYLTAFQRSHSMEREARKALA